MSIQKYARAQKQTVPASKFTYSRASLRDTKYWGRSLHATMCADLNYWSPRRKPMFDLKFEIWGFLGPCGQNKVATLHFYDKIENINKTAQKAETLVRQPLVPDWSDSRKERMRVLESCPSPASFYLEEVQVLHARFANYFQLTTFRTDWNKTIQDSFESSKHKF